MYTPFYKFLKHIFSHAFSLSDKKLFLIFPKIQPKRLRTPWNLFCGKKKCHCFSLDKFVFIFCSLLINFYLIRILDECSGKGSSGWRPNTQRVHLMEITLNGTEQLAMYWNTCKLPKTICFKILKKSNCKHVIVVLQQNRMQ